MNDFLVALQFLTRLPVRPRPADAGAPGRAMLWYPAVGLVIGLLLWGMLALAAPLGAQPAAALVLVVWVLVTGALHLDGLSDSADAWLGGQGDRERTLAILKDTHAGAAGVTAIALVLLLKFAALAAGMADPEAATAMVLAAPVVGRLGLLALFANTPYVRPGGLGERLAATLPRDAARWVLIGSWLILLLLLGARVVPVFLVAVLLFLSLRYLMLQRIRGTTGDTAGACVEILEAGVLLACLM